MRWSVWHAAEEPDLDRNLVIAVSGLPRVSVDEDYWRHALRKEWLNSGSATGGRWGPAGAYPVCYLGRPVESTVAEAHRNLVEGVEGMRPEVVGPRWCGRLRVIAENVLDLRELKSRLALGLANEDLAGPWEKCQPIGQAAHQLGMHGLIVPAATGIGLTLALFERHLAPEERPVLVEAERWEHLPPDPRKPRLVRDQDGEL
jgi:RES domain-containing protein